MTDDELPGFELEALIARTHAGAVWRARDGASGRACAVKRGRPGDEVVGDALRHEAAVLSVLDHPGVVRLERVVADGDGVALVLELVDGPDLAARLRHGGLPVDEGVEIVAAVADAVAAVHRCGVLHLDVKPANIVLDPAGRPVLVDFGAAQRTADVAAGDTGSASVVTGTAEYLDPARLRGWPADERSDVYGLGATCWAVLAGRAPHLGGEPAAVIAAARAGERPPLEDLVPVPPAVAEVVARAMAAEPADRWPDAGAFAAALRAAAVTPAPTTELSARRRGAGAPPPRPVLGPEPPTLPAERRGHPWRPASPAARIGAAVAVLGAAAAAFVVLGPGIGGGRPSAAAEDTHIPEPTRRTIPERTTATDPATTTTAVPTPAPAAIPGCPPRPGEVACGTVRVEWSDGLAVVTDGDDPAVRYHLGRPGDQLVLADWDCDGDPDPILYRPSSGGLYRFHGWPVAADGTVSEPVEAVPAGGVARVVDRDGDGCADVVVDEAAPEATADRPVTS